MGFEGRFLFFSPPLSPKTFEFSKLRGSADNQAIVKVLSSPGKKIIFCKDV